MDMIRIALTRYFLTSLVCAFGLVSEVWAEVSSPLSPFVADVPVESQGLSKRSAAAELGLLDVLVRVSGSEDVRYNDDILARTSSAIRYVEQFEYLEADDSLTEQGYRALLRMHFSERLVKRLLSETGQKFWSISRPSVLVWLVEDSLEHGKQMVGPAQDSELVSGLLEGASYRGIPLAFPLMDFQDQVALGVQRLWELDEGAILDASERYQPEVILVGKYTTTSAGQLWSNWQFFYKGDSRVYDLRGDQQAKVGQGAIMPLADFLARMFAVKLSENDTEYYFANINNIRSFGDYRGVIKALSGVDAIGDVLLDGATDDVVNLRFKSEASINQLTGLLSLNKQLNPRNEAEQNQLPAWQRAQRGSSENPLLYRWSR